MIVLQKKLNKYALLVEYDARKVVKVNAKNPKDARLKFYGTRFHKRTEASVIKVKKIGKSKKYWK